MDTLQVFLVDIGSSCLAELSVTSFENATKRNVPPLKHGDLIHGRITTAHRHTPPTVSCTDASGKSSGMGVLKGGCTKKVTTAFARSLLSSPLHPVLEALGNQIAFEIVIGMNGLIWVHAQSPSTSIFVCNLIAECEGCDRITAKELCEAKLKNAFHG